MVQIKVGLKPHDMRGSSSHCNQKGAVMPEEQRTDESIMSESERRRALAQAVARSVAEGWRVESQTGEMAVLVRGGKPNHVLHVILSVLTLGIWLLVWAFIGLLGGEKRRMISIDDYGNVLVSDL